MPIIHIDRSGDGYGLTFTCRQRIVRELDRFRLEDLDSQGRITRYTQWIAYSECVTVHTNMGDVLMNPLFRWTEVGYKEG